MDLTYYIKKIFHQPGIIGVRFMKATTHLWNDELYLRLMYFFTLGHKLNLKKPILFSHKLQWLKLYYRDPNYTNLVDKVAVKKWVETKIGSEYLIPTIGIWNKSAEIDFSKLPKPFILKCSHNSHSGIVICHENSDINEKKYCKILDKGLNQNFWMIGREWPYKDITPRILAEPFLDNKGKPLVDYKFFCFDGDPKMVMVCIDRPISKGDPKFYFMDKNWQPIPINDDTINAGESLDLKPPTNIYQMWDIATTLSHGLPHVRVDLYNIDGKIYFSEMTFFHYSGMDPHLTREGDKYLGKLISLPKL